MVHRKYGQQHRADHHRRHHYRFALPTAGSVPDEITAGPDGNLWFTEDAGNRIGRITPSGTITEFAVPTASSAPGGITAGPDGNLWFAENTGNKTGRITPSGTITEFAIPTAASFPEGITAGPDGNLWLAEMNANQIGRSTLTSSGLTISPTTPLPAITDQVNLDGTTERTVLGLPAAGPPVVQINGNRLSGDGLVLGSSPAGASVSETSSAGSTILGLDIYNFDGSGIHIQTDGNLITGNFLGTNAAGTAAVGNELDGILLNNASSNRIIGNVVSGNGIGQDAAGINLEANDSKNIIAGNKIGTNAAGDAALGNSLHGIFLGNGSSNNTIGGTTVNDRNVIAGNGKFPVADLATQGGVEVYIFGANTSGNVVQGNYIGTNAAGTAALDNSVIGVLINQSGSNAVRGNVISGNQLIGLEIAGGTAAGNQVQGNKIGTNAGGTAAIPNGFDGIFINDAPNNTIGGTAAGAGNLISGNGSVGIQLFDTLTSGNVIQGNALGLDAAGRPTLPNRAGGIFVNTSPRANQLGGTGPGEANQGQVRPVFGLPRLANPGPTSSVAARRQSRRG